MYNEYIGKNLGHMTIKSVELAGSFYNISSRARELMYKVVMTDGTEIKLSKSALVRMREGLE